MTFITTKTINNEDNQYCKEYCIFIKYFDDTRYFIYSFITSETDNNLNFFEVDANIYLEEIQKFTDPIEITVADEFDLMDQISFIRLKAEKNLQSITEILGLKDISIPKYLFNENEESEE